MYLTYKNTNLNISLYKNNAITEDEEIFREIFRVVVRERSKIEKEIVKNLLFKYFLEPVEINHLTSAHFVPLTSFVSFQNLCGFENRGFSGQARKSFGDFQNPGDFQNAEINDAPDIIKLMVCSSKTANVGPMASVAGAISEILCGKCIEFGFDAGLIENGGDIALFGDRNFKVKIYAGNSPFSNKFFISLNPAKLFPDKILGICTSSSSVGPSVSFGEGDATTIISNSPAIADAFATSLGNLVKNDEESIKEVIELGKKFKEIYGICIIVKDKIGVWNVNLEKI